MGWNVFQCAREVANFDSQLTLPEGDSLSTQMKSAFQGSFLRPLLRGVLAGSCLHGLPGILARRTEAVYAIPHCDLVQKGERHGNRCEQVDSHRR